MEQNNSETNKINGNKIICENIECFASTAELLRPKEKSKVEELSTVTLGFTSEIDIQKNSEKTDVLEFYLTLDAVLP